MTAAANDATSLMSIADAPPDKNNLQNILAMLRDPSSALKNKWPEYMHSSMKVLLAITEDNLWIETVSYWIHSEEQLGFPTSKVSRLA